MSFPIPPVVRSAILQTLGLTNIGPDARLAIAGAGLTFECYERAGDRYPNELWMVRSACRKARQSAELARATIVGRFGPADTGEVSSVLHWVSEHPGFEFGLVIPSLPSFFGSFVAVKGMPIEHARAAASMTGANGQLLFWNGKSLFAHSADVWCELVSKQ